VPLPSWVPERMVATAVVVACGAAHATVGRFATRAGTAIVAVKMLVILVLVVVGECVIAGRPPVATTVTTAPSAGAFAATVTWIMFSYIGFNQAVYVAAEAVDPVRTVPRALVVGTLVTTAAYLLLNDVFLRSAPYDVLAGRADVASRAALALAGPAFDTALRSLVALATFTSVASMMMTGPRITTCMAEDGVFPRWCAGAGGVRNSVLLHTALAVLLVHQATILGLLGYLGVTLSLVSALTVATLWLPAAPPRDGDESPPSPRAAVAARVAASVYIVATLGFIGLLVRHDPRQLLGTAATFASAGLIWLVMRRRS